MMCAMLCRKAEKGKQNDYSQRDFMPKILDKIGKIRNFQMFSIVIDNNSVIWKIICLLSIML